MKGLIAIGALFFILFAASCDSYHGFSRHNDTVYLVGWSGFWIFGRSWVKECRYTAPNTSLVCRRLILTDGILPMSSVENGT